MGSTDYVYLMKYIEDAGAKYMCIELVNLVVMLRVDTWRQEKEAKHKAFCLRPGSPGVTRAAI